jgi:hypothetical protein
VYALIAQSEANGIEQYQRERDQIKLWGECVQATADPVELYVQAAGTKKAHYDPIIHDIVDSLAKDGVVVDLSLPQQLKHYGRIMEKVCKKFCLRQPIAT